MSLSRPDTSQIMSLWPHPVNSLNVRPGSTTDSMMIVRDREQERMVRSESLLTPQTYLRTLLEKVSYSQLVPAAE